MEQIRSGRPAQISEGIRVDLALAGNHTLYTIAWPSKPVLRLPSEPDLSFVFTGNLCCGKHLLDSKCETVCADTEQWRGLLLTEIPSMALFTIFRAAFGYLFLVLVLRIAGRRPGKQLSPFDYVMVFFLGGIMLTGIVGPEASLTNALCQIITVALCHCGLAWLRSKYDVAFRIIDGGPLVLMANKRWRTETLSKVRLQDDDVMDSARSFGRRDLDSIRMAVLEPVGEITVIPRKEVEK